MRSGHIEQIGSFLGGQFGVYRHHSDCIAFGESVENFFHEAQCRDRQFHLMRPVCFIKELNAPCFALAGKTGRKSPLTPGRQLDFLFVRQLHAGVR
ncbi:hypothetical protein RLIN73S_01228 [Rhodanobacter lindaniclasticus]